jgi:pilus assembly protein CpaE
MAVIVIENAAALADSIGATRVVRDLKVVSELGDDLVVVGPDIDLQAALEFSAAARIADPARGVVLVRNHIDAEVLTGAMQAGVRQVVQTGDTVGLRQACTASLALSEQVRLVHNTAPAPTGHVITVFGSKGGCGKTTVSTNLAAALATSGRRTCVVDLDLAFGDVAIVLGLSPEHTIADAIPMAGTLDAEGIRSLIVEHSSGLHALLAPIEPAVAEQVTPELVGHLLQQLKEMYEVVVVDSPPAFTENVLAALDVSDRIVLLATPDIPAVKNLKLALQTLDQLDSAADRRMLVLNRADAHTGLSAADVRKLLGVSLDAEIPAHRAVPASINRGVTLVLDQPGHAVSKAIRALARDLQPVAEVAPAHHRATQADKRLFRRKVATA